MSNLPTNYTTLISHLKERIRSARYKASLLVNREMLFLYWEIGNTISEQQKTEGWGSKVIDRLSVDLKTEFPDFKGLSVRNLKYMKTFAEAYPEFGQEQLAQIQNPDKLEDTIVQVPLAQLTWYHHLTILTTIKDQSTRLFYIQETIKNGWSRDVMLRNIESKLHERQGNAITNFQTTLPAIQSDLAQQTIKSPYNFDFVAFGEEMKERNLEKALIEHLKKFMLELGKGFAYVGNQKNLVVDGDDFFLDLLFFNTELNCYVIFELKIGDFKPEFAGKLNFYVNTVDEQLKKEHHAKTIGVLLCKTPNETVVKYSLKGIESPIGVAEYLLSEVLPNTVDAEILSIEAVESELEQEIKELKTPTDKKLDKLKDLISKLNKDEVSIKLNKNTQDSIVQNHIEPLILKFINKIETIKNEFNNLRIDMYFDSNGRMITHSYKHSIFQLASQQSDLYYSLKFVFYFEGFKYAGTQTFDNDCTIEIQFQHFKYQFLNAKEVILEKLYDQLLNELEINTIIDSYIEKLVESISKQVEKLI